MSENNRHKIFLSYCHENKKIADELYKILTITHKFPVWRDIYCIQHGSNSYESMFDGLVNSELVICCITKEYLDSEACIREFTIANHKKKLCLALMLDKVDIDNNPKIAWFTIGMQRCNIYKNKKEDPPLGLWEGDRFNDFIQTIKKNLETNLQNQTSTDDNQNKKVMSRFDAFISYDIETARRTNTLVDVLKINGFNIYRQPLKICEETSDFECTKNAIDESSVFICCLTKSYTKNKTCLNEIDYADRTNKPKIILLYEACQNDLGDLIDDAHIIQMYEENTGRQKLIENNNKIDNLITKLRLLLNRNESKEELAEEQKSIRITSVNDGKSNRYVETFAKNLGSDLVSSVSYNPNQVPNYNAVKDSVTLVAIVTPQFQNSFACCEEVSCASRNSIPVLYILDERMKIENKTLAGFITEKPSNTHIGLDKLTVPIERNVIAQSLDKIIHGKHHSGKCLCDCIADVYEAQVNAEKIFFKAARMGNIELLNYLLHGRGFHVNYKGPNGETALFCSVYNEKFEAVKWLCENGANIRETDDDGELVTFKAASRGNIDILKYLINLGSKINHKSKNGETALFRAAYNDKLETVKWLHENGADIKATNDEDESVLFLAAHKGCVAILDYLVRNNCNIDHKNRKGETALFRAVYKSKLDAVKWLSENGANVHETNNDGETVLFIAANKGNIEILEYLVQRGLNINHKNKSGKTPLFKAASKDELDMVKWLCDNGANINDKDNNGRRASFQKNLDTNSIKYLLEREQK